MEQKNDQIELSWKDAISSMLAAAVIILYLIKINYIYLPFTLSSRLAIMILTIINLAMWGLSSIGVAKFKDPLIKIASYLGVISLLLIIFGLILGSKAIMELLTFTTLLFWTIMTIQHYLGSVKRYLKFNRHYFPFQ